MQRIFSLLVVSVVFVANASAHDIVLRDQGKGILGISYPSDWKQVVEKNNVIATSEDGTAWSVISTLDEVQNKKSGVLKIKEGLEEYLTEIKFDKVTETESGSMVLSGTGKGKKSGVDLVFTSAVFESGPSKFAGLVFIVDADIEKYYEKTILAICKSVLVEQDFANEAEIKEEEAAVTR